jgi:hypothetical protein
MTFKGSKTHKRKSVVHQLPEILSIDASSVKYNFSTMGDWGMMNKVNGHNDLNVALAKFDKDGECKKLIELYVRGAVKGKEHAASLFKKLVQYSIVDATITKEEMMVSKKVRDLLNLLIKGGLPDTKAESIFAKEYMSDFQLVVNLNSTEKLAVHCETNKLPLEKLKTIYNNVIQWIRRTRTRLIEDMELEDNGEMMVLEDAKKRVRIKVVQMKTPEDIMNAVDVGFVNSKKDAEKKRLEEEEEEDEEGEEEEEDEDEEEGKKEGEDDAGTSVLSDLSKGEKKKKSRKSKTDVLVDSLPTLSTCGAAFILLRDGVVHIGSAGVLEEVMGGFQKFDECISENFVILK